MGRKRERKKQSKMFEMLMTQWFLVFVEPLLELQPQPVLMNLPVARTRLLGCEELASIYLRF
jgi:hypothetical protein